MEIQFITKKCTQIFNHLRNTLKKCGKKRVNSQINFEEKGPNKGNKLKEITFFLGTHHHAMWYLLKHPFTKICVYSNIKYTLNVSLVF